MKSPSCPFVEVIKPDRGPVPILYRALYQDSWWFTVSIKVFSILCLQPNLVATKNLIFAGANDLG